MRRKVARRKPTVVRRKKHQRSWRKVKITNTSKEMWEQSKIAKHIFSNRKGFKKMRQKTKNTRMLELIQELKKASIENDAAIWKRIAEDLEKPNRKQRIVNVYSIARNAKDGETVIVPGKVLGTGDIDKEVVVAAYNFSDSAYQKLKSSGKVLTIKELIKKNPEGKNVRILG